MPSVVEPGYERTIVGKHVYHKPMVLRVRGYLYSHNTDYNNPENNDIKIRSDLWIFNGVAVEYQPLCSICPDSKTIKNKDGSMILEVSNFDQTLDMIWQSIDKGAQ